MATPPKGRKARYRPPIDFHVADRAFTPYALAIGQAALAWNYLQEVLAALFETITIGETNMRGVWYSQPNDRPRIQMLIAAISGRRPYIIGDDPHDKYCAAVLELCSEVAKLNEKRNVAVHSPFVLMQPEMAQLFGTASGVIPQDRHGNPNALKLKHKNPLIEFRWLRDSALALSRHAILLNHAWTKRGPLPDTLRLPTREHQKSRQGRHRPARAK